jgi:hypothetical protein
MATHLDKLEKYRIKVKFLDGVKWFYINDRCYWKQADMRMPLLVVHAHDFEWDKQVEV